MTSRPTSATLPLAIGSVERDTGLSKDTLRVWERRYGFPRPGRNAHGERVYPAEQVVSLLLIKRLIDQGHRPARVVGQPDERLRALLETAAASRGAAVPSTTHAKLSDYLEAVKQASGDTLQRRLEWALLDAGLARFVTEVVAPLTTLVGDAWNRGDIQIYEEHRFSEIIGTLLRSTLQNIPRGEGSPRVLLTTLPGESHGLGLLMAQVMLALEGCQCVSLGPQTPRAQLVEAARHEGADLIGLSFSALARPQAIDEDLRWVRAHLPDDVEVWAGGGGVQQRGFTLPAGVHIFDKFADLQHAITGWRAAHQAPRSGAEDAPVRAKKSKPGTAVPVPGKAAPDTAEAPAPRARKPATRSAKTRR